MILNSRLIFELARSLEAAIVTVTDGELVIGTEISPIIDLQLPLNNLGGFSPTLAQQTSFSHDESQNMAASTAQTIVTVATFSRGLWDVAWTLSSVSDFSNVLADSAQCQLLDPEASSNVLARTALIANVPQTIQHRMRLLLSEDGWLMRLLLTATGVGQTQRGSLSVTANRLL